MSSESHINICNAAELLVESGNSPRYLFTPGAGTRSESLGEGKSISQGDFSNQSTVTSIQTESWSNTTGNEPGPESSRVRQSRQEASPTSIDRLALLASVASSSVFCSGSSSQPFAANMSTYLSGSNAQAEALQTLYLMNPSYTGYGDSSNSGNMVLFSPGTGAVGGHGNPLGSSDPQHQHQHFVRFSLPSAVTQSPLSHQSHGASMSNTDLGHQSNSSDFYGSRPNSHGYNWGGGNELLSFIPSSHVTEDNQPLGVRVNSVKSGQLSTSGMSHYGIGNLSESSFLEQAPLFSNSVAAHGLNMENLQAPSGAGQTLSLSLSPQQPSMMQQIQSFPLQHTESAPNFFHVLSNAGSDSNLSKEGVLANKCVGGSVGSSFTVPSCASMLGTGYQSQLNGTENNRQVNMVASHFTMGSYGSKYLKSAQELLNEVVSVGRGIKGNSLKQSKPQSWMGPSSASDGSFAKGMIAGDLPSKSVVSWSGGKEEEPVATAVPIIAAGISEQMTENAELTSANRQELQAKRLKLMGMRDEVDRRYKQYYHQMQVIVASFESAAGLGAATTYTALALQTISKHFRCLRDAISGQIQVACKALGEEEVSGLARGETSKLRFIDQQLRQQRALRQLGMMQQQAWRPQRGLPEHSVSILRAWLFEHFLHPYPKDADKILLARQTGLTRNQVSNWFINARVRLWKPMVEEMYLEETKEGDADGADKSGGDEGAISEGVTAGFMDGAANSEMSKPLKQAKLSDENHEGFSEAKHSSNYASDMLQGRNPAGSPSDSLLFHEKEGTRQGVMKPKNGLQDTSSFLFPNSSTGIDFKSDRPHGDDVLQHEIKIRTEDSYREPYGIAHNGFVQADHLNPIGYGSYQVSGPNRYSQESFAPSYAANGGVSLTLGLQHCEGLSFSGAQQHYGQGQAHLSTGRREEDGVGSADYYSVNDSSYEALGLQNRKPFPTHMLRHDFVV